MIIYQTKDKKVRIVKRDNGTYWFVDCRIGESYPITDEWALSHVDKQVFGALQVKGE